MTPRLDWPEVGGLEPGVDVLLTFDFDAMSAWIADGTATPGPLSRGQFAEIGIRRLLPLLAECGARATFFTPGQTVRAYPGVIEDLVAAGHEIGHHGWVHESPGTLSVAEQEAVIDRGIEAIESVAGAAPVGYRAPNWDPTEETLGALIDRGFVYDSSLMGADYEPYRCRLGDEASTDGAYRFGAESELLELPVAWHLDDFPQYEFVPNLGVQGLRPASQVYETWRGEFDYAHERLDHGMYLLTMHPEVSGRGHRLMMLERLLEYFSGRGARFCTCADYAARWIATLRPDS